jgi:uncharacterized membrane protein
MLPGLEILLAGIWVGSYLFTTLIVTPGLRSLPLGEARRVTIRSAIGRRYGRLAGLLVLAWILLLLLQGLSGWVLVRFVLLLILAGIVSLHAYIYGSRLQRLAAREHAGEAAAATERARLQRLSARVTPLSLVLSVLLGALTLL